MLPAIAAQGLADAVDGFCEGIAFSPGQMARVFEAAKAHRPAGQAARRPAVEPARRRTCRALRRAVGRSSRIYRRSRSGRHGEGRHGRGDAARRLLLHPRDQEAAGRAVPPARRRDGGRHGLQPRHLAADLAAADHEHGRDAVRHDGRRMPRRRHARSGACARPLRAKRERWRAANGPISRSGTSRARPSSSTAWASTRCASASGGVCDRIRPRGRQRLACRLARHLSGRRAGARSGLQAARDEKRRGGGAHRGARRAGLRHQHRLRQAGERAHSGRRSRNPAAQHRAVACGRRRRADARRRGAADDGAEACQPCAGSVGRPARNAGAAAGHARERT